MAWEMKRVTLSNGLVLPYAEQGDATGVPVVLLHGFGGTWRSFERVLPELPAALRVFAPTQRGHGAASKPEAGYRLQDFSDDVAAFLNAVDVEEAVIVGHSMGAAVAQYVGVDYPEHTQGLVLAGACVAGPGGQAVQAFWNSTVAGLRDPVDPQMVRDWLAGMAAAPVPPEVFEHAVEDALQMPARVWRAIWRSRLDLEDFTTELQDIRAPALLVWGAQDARCPRREQEALLGAIPNSRLVAYEDVGHDVPLEAPKRLAADIVRFVGESVGP